MSVDTQAYIVASNIDIFAVVKSIEDAAGELFEELMVEENLTNGIPLHVDENLKSSHLLYINKISTMKRFAPYLPESMKVGFYNRGVLYSFFVYADSNGHDINQVVKGESFESSISLLLPVIHSPMMKRIGENIKRDTGFRVFFVENDSKDEEYVEL